MKQIRFRCAAVLITFLLGVSCSLCAQMKKASSQEATAVLRRLSKRMASLSRVSYHYRRELNYASEGYHNVLEGDVYIEFDPEHQPAGAIYQVHDAAGFEIYNGSEILHGIKATHTLQMTPVRSANGLEHVSYLYNSVLTLRLALPKLLGDTGVVKSLARLTDSSFEVDVRIPRAVLTATGKLLPLTLPRDITYRITVDRRSFLPQRVRETNSQNGDFRLVEFSRMNANPAKLPEDSWFYSSYKGYHPTVPGPTRELLPVDSAAPRWTLPVATGAVGNRSLEKTLKDGKTKLVLVEFWISHCGYSIGAVAGLNALASHFASAGLKVLAVNPDDSESTIRLFAKNYHPHYTLIADGGRAARQYGVSGFPAVFLVNKKGTIVYSGGFDEQLLAEKIAPLLR